MSWTIRGAVHLNAETQAVHYRCHCGKVYIFPLTEIVADEPFICPICQTMTTFTSDTLAGYYQTFGLPKPD